MRTLLRVFFLVFLAAAAPAGPPLPAPPATFDPAAVNKYIAATLRARDMAGLSVAIAREGVVQLAGAYGKSSLATGAPVTTNTLFAVGSVTKQFTAACVLLLAQEGRLSVRDKVARYYPILARAHDISLLDLMNHVSGYADYYPLDFVDSRMEAPIAADDLIARYAGGKLDFEPGSQWSYSNTGYVILGRVVEKASGEPLGAFMTRRILRPLGMAHSVFGPAVAGQDYAQGYTRFALGPLVPARTEARGWLEGAAGLSTTALDLVKWDMALIQGRVLNAQSYALMTTPRQLSTGRAREYRLRHRRGHHQRHHRPAARGPNQRLYGLEHHHSGDSFRPGHSVQLRGMGRGGPFDVCPSQFHHARAAVDSVHCGAGRGHGGDGVFPRLAGRAR